MLLLPILLLQAQRRMAHARCPDLPGFDVCRPALSVRRGRRKHAGDLAGLCLSRPRIWVTTEFSVPSSFLLPSFLSVQLTVCSTVHTLLAMSYFTVCGVYHPPRTRHDGQQQQQQRQGSQSGSSSRYLNVSYESARRRTDDAVERVAGREHTGNYFLAHSVIEPETQASSTSPKLSRASKDILFGSVAGMVAKVFEHPL